MFKGLESEFRLSEQVLPSYFCERNSNDQTPFLGVTGCCDVFDQGARSQGSKYITKKYFTGDSSTKIFFCELTRTLISESFDQETKRSL